MMHIIGAGGHAKVIADIAKCSNEVIEAVWDEDTTLEYLLDFPIRGNMADFKHLNSTNFIIGVGSNKTRKIIADELLPASIYLQHPSSIVAVDVRVGNGTVLMANSTVNASSIIGVHVIINTNASVDHDCRIGNFVHVSPQVGVAGGVEIGEGSHIGIGANVIQGIKIGKWATIGAGAVIIENVPDYAVVVGNPGKIIKYNS